MKFEITDEGLAELKSAIVHQAIKDYKIALEYLKDDGFDQRAKKVKEECEDIFLSGYWKFVSQYNGEEIMNKVRVMARFDNEEWESKFL